MYQSMMVRLLALVVALGMTGCAHLGSVSTTSVPEQRDNPVEVKTSRFVFFYLNFNNDYVNELTEGLAEKCPNGRVEGVLTKLETVTWFPVIAHTIRVRATGYCVDGAPIAAPTPSDAPTPVAPSVLTAAEEEP